MGFFRRLAIWMRCPSLRDRLGRRALQEQMSQAEAFAGAGPVAVKAVKISFSARDKAGRDNACPAPIGQLRDAGLQQACASLVPR